MNLKVLSRIFAVVLIAGQASAADSKKDARVTQIIRDVRLMPSDAATRPAAVNDKVGEDTGVRTGGESRSELTFVDLTITRLGANTIFSFNKAGHNTEIDSGSILFCVPKNSGGGRITSSGVSVAVTGTTVILEAIRGNRLYVLEGGARISLIKYPSQFQNLRAGQMVDVPPGAKTIPPPTNFDINDLMKKHPLITDFPPLPSLDLIAAAAQQQPPPQTAGAAALPILPVVNLGGIAIPIGPRGTGGGRGTGRNPTGGQTQPTSPTTPTGTGQGTAVGGNRPPTNTPPGKGQGPVASPGKGQPTPPPVIYRQPPGRTVGAPATGGTTQTRPRSNPPPRKRVSPPPPTSGPR